ncbi:hypothetical protein BOTBODRAFT_167949 [Botryobasidium botryosum FD-172 SS1]|uniref:Uncharacterized protein n=1 Tax=Botryobasidium botryosum (strain FD-172 SS1) TaxID=930990 RepID=A0A067LU02_BOTB1|nr:hypothetical protein BOTBODRAFT_167949 [Botryobasidium botryosum FD-172 SS1]
MARLRLTALGADTSLIFVLTALFASALFNIFALWRIRDTIWPDHDRWSYIGGDHPHQLPIHLPPVALTVENTEHYSVASYRAFIEWDSLDFFPKDYGFVQLGPGYGRRFGVAMIHQLHCLNAVRQALVKGRSDKHIKHCFNLLRQTILCASDTTLDPINVSLDGGVTGTDGVGVTHVCRDWTKVYEYVQENQKLWPASLVVMGMNHTHMHM